jgi:Zn ribbon nucleic-acid-binding protein
MDLALIREERVEDVFCVASGQHMANVLIREERENK